MVSSGRPPSPAAGAVAGPGEPGAARPVVRLPGVPVVGHVVPFLRDRLGFLVRAGRCGSVVRLQLGRPTYLVCDPDDLRHVLIGRHDNYVKSPRVVGRGTRRRLGDNLFTLAGEAHAQRRRQLGPLFHRRVVEPLIDGALAGARARVAAWRDGQVVDLEREADALVGEVVRRALFGAGGGRLDGAAAAGLELHRRWVESLFLTHRPLAHLWPTAVNRAYGRSRRLLARALATAIGERRAAPGPPRDLLGLLCQVGSDDGLALTDGEVRDEVLALATAGVETLGAGLTWAWALQAGHPQHDARLAAECAAVLGGRAAEAADASRLEFCRRLLSEAMRLYPPTWLFVRVALAADVLPGGARVPAGARLYLCQYLTHRDPRLFPDPERFDPDRFGEASVRPRLAFFPFGAGPRQCLGEGFAWTVGVLLLATVGQRFRLELAPGPLPAPHPGITLRPRAPVEARLIARPPWAPAAGGR